MIEITVLKTKVSVSPMFFMVLTAVLLLDKTGISGFAVLFSILHELGHLLALLSQKVYPISIKTDVFGIHISLPENLSTEKKCFVLVSGFAVNFILSLLFFAAGNKIFFYINLVIGIFTAMPLSSTDGGAVLKTILFEFIPQKEEKIFKIISFLFCAAVSVFLAVSIAFTGNYFILIALIYMVLCTVK